MTTRPHRFLPLHSVLLTALAIAALLPAPLARAAETDERWYVVMMQGSRVGWMVERSYESDEQIRSETQMHLSIGRGAQSVTVEFSSEFAETADHAPIAMKSVQQFGAAPLETVYRFNDDGTVTVQQTQGGRTTERVENTPAGEWVTPGEAGEAFNAALDSGAEQFNLTLLDPMSGLTPVTATYTVVGTTTVEAMGKTVPAIECRVAQSVMPGVAGTEFVGPDGSVIRADTNLGGITMTVLLSEKELALLPAEPVEMLASSLVTPDKPIANPRFTNTGVYVLRLADGEMPDLPTEGAQRTERLDDKTVRVVINTEHRRAAPDADAANPAYTEANAYLDADDPQVQALTRDALADEEHKPDFWRAELLRRAVFEHIDEKNLGVGFATASEVCRTGEGDCTEHAVLLAAMLRAAGIPSRVASGLIYADAFAGHEHIFGYHAWAQALVEVDGVLQWHDVDATLPANGPPFDATHITLSVSSMGEGEVVNSLAALVPLLGQLSIEVEETE